MSMVEPDAEDFEPAEELTIEEQARLRGWKPEEEYRGPPGRWRSAEDFMRIGQNDLAITREENRRLATKLGRLEKNFSGLQNTMAEQTAALKHMTDLARRADKQGYDRAMRELKAQRSEAVEAGDKTAFEQIEQQINTLESERVEAEKPPTSEPPKPVMDPDIEAFIKANPWYSRDEVLGKAMIGFYDIVQRKHPDFSVDEILAEAKRRTIAEWPEKFPQTRRPAAPVGDEIDHEEDEPVTQRRAAPPALSPSGNAPRRPRPITGIDQITDPAERAQARQAFESTKRADPAFTEAEYMMLYNNPHLDVIELRRNRKA